MAKLPTKSKSISVKNVTNTLFTDYTYQGCRPEVRSLILKMTVNSSGIRDISRVLQVSPNTVQSIILKRARKIPDVRLPTRAKTVKLDEL